VRARNRAATLAKRPSWPKVPNVCSATTQSTQDGEKTADTICAPDGGEADSDFALANAQQESLRTDDFSSSARREAFEFTEKEFVLKYFN